MIENTEAMEMRAREDVGLAQDLIPPVSPLAAALHGRFLAFHCTACFRPLESPLLCAACRGATRYCSAACFTADSSAHSASGECRLLFLRHNRDDGDTDLRVALRFLHLFESTGPVHLASLPERPRRVAGLLASDLEKVIEEEGEMAERIAEGAALMSLARDRDRSRVGGGEAVTPEEVLWAVLTNAVEVQVSEVGPLGVAVYGPGFSWFNHSCLPNACYRFELAQSSSEQGCAKPKSLLASPAAVGVAADTLKAWICAGSGLAHGFSKFGPRVIVRSIKPIKKDEKICITYIDLLQPKIKRQSDLWEKYRFVCRCWRCSLSSQIYMDLVLNGIELWQLR
ncbi:protein SET DOMAIN GROUP 41 isoform X2 [Canna indica]|uniref:Protein SET DOMAIN GROUP 41 isoform X2 n=1 Tax=Canna indica TaxID=4628 RepID=A0AAQ3KQG4_9LILI|nr:protein SET DOMAIN GROUP 41 isoform X2 [Canna indica]